MAKTYATLTGSRSTLTQRGGNDGVKVSAQSYDGSVIVENWYNNDNQLMVRIDTNDGSSCCGDWNSTEFRGTFKDLKDLLALAADIKNGKVSVVRHRDSKNKIKK